METLRSPHKLVSTYQVYYALYVELFNQYSVLQQTPVASGRFLCHPSREDSNNPAGLGLRLAVGLVLRGKEHGRCQKLNWTSSKPYTELGDMMAGHTQMAPRWHPDGELTGYCEQQVPTLHDARFVTEYGVMCSQTILPSSSTLDLPHSTVHPVVHSPVPV
jgi:hypothetical protein